jgi:hypothetical protein
MALFGAGVAVALALNLVLLGMTSERDDPVGRLTPVTVVSGAGPPPPPAVTGGATSPGGAATSGSTITEPAGADLDDDHADRGEGGAADEDD